jgi:hypothetical protein
MTKLKNVTCMVGFAIAVAMLIAIISGCHGGGGGVVQSGSLQVTMVWPARPDGELQPRLIPERSESVLVKVLGDEGLIGETLLVRPTEPPWESTANFASVPVGTFEVQATACPGSDGTGTPQARAAMTVIVEAGKNGYPAAGNPGDQTILTLISTIARVMVTPPAVDIGVGIKTRLTATAFDDQSRAVLIPLTSPFAWAVTTGSSVAEVDDEGLVTGLAMGTATVQATEQESAVSGTATVRVSAAAGGYVFVTKWGGMGEGEGEFGEDSEVGIHADTAGNLYVTDPGNFRIQKFDCKGNFVQQWPMETGVGDEVPPRPIGISTDAANNVYVADYSGCRVLIFNSNGSLLRQWSTCVLSVHQLQQWNTAATMDDCYQPYDLDLDDEGNVYICARDSHRIVKYTNNGTCITGWGSQGRGAGEFDSPQGLVVDRRRGVVFVNDHANHRLHKYSTDGELITRWGQPGTGNGQFGTGNWGGLGIDGDGNVYMADLGNYRVQKFSGKGQYMTQWGSNGTEPGQLIDPRHVTVDSEGNVYVFAYFQIHKFRPLRGDVGVVID